MTTISKSTSFTKWATLVPACGAVALYSHKDINRNGNEQPRKVGGQSPGERLIA